MLTIHHSIYLFDSTSTLNVYKYVYTMISNSFCLLLSLENKTNENCVETKHESLQVQSTFGRSEFATQLIV